MQYYLGMKKKISLYLYMYLRILYVSFSWIRIFRIWSGFFGRSGSGLRKKDPIRIRIRNTGHETRVSHVIEGGRPCQVTAWCEILNFFILFVVK